MGKTRDKTVYMATGLGAFGGGADPGSVDVIDGQIARIRPLRLLDKYSVEDLNPWTLEARGKRLKCSTKTSIAPLQLAYKNRIYSKNRIPYPLKRVDWDPDGERNPQNRGKSKYVRISWDEATDIIASEIRRCIDTYGNTSIFIQGDGHGETKVMHASHGCSTRLMNLMGGYTLQARQPDSWEGWYWGGKHMWGMEPVGQQAMQSNMLKEVCEYTDTVICVGADPETTPLGWGGMGPSQISFFWTEIGIKQIYICPDLNYAAAVHADKWIPVLPNTDAALWLGVAYTWLTEGTYEKEYVDTHTTGFDKFCDYVLGRTDGTPKTPKWAEGKCQVPSRQIKALARHWANHNVMTAHCNGGGYIRSVFSHEPARLEIALLAMQGIGMPGRNMFKFIEWGLFGDPSYDPMPHTEWGTFMWAGYTGHMSGTDLVTFIPQTLIPDAITLPEGEKITWYGTTVCTEPLESQYTQYEYPAEGASRIHMFWTDTPCWSTCWNGGNRMQDALRHPSIEFMLVQHPWLENDTLFGDIILPINTKFEEDDIISTMWNATNPLVINEEQAIEPLYESKSDSEAVLAIAEKLGMAEALMTFWCYPEMVDYQATATTTGGEDANFGALKQAAVKPSENLEADYPFGPPSYEALKQRSYMLGGCFDHMDYEEFLEKGYLPIRYRDGWEEDPVGMRGFYEDPENNPLKTPSGKIEFYSTSIADHWGDDGQRPPVPQWIEESEEHHERLTNERGKKFPFLVVSNHPRFRVHAQGDDAVWLREIKYCKVKGPDGYLYEPVWINPLDASEKGIKDGDIVKIFNERGAVLGGAIVTERICRHAISQDHGARVDSIVTGEGGLDRGGANNLICPSKTTSINAPGEVTNGFLADIEKVDVFELAEKYPEAFNRDYDPAEGPQPQARIIEGA